ncbi:unnamed protein product, partial [Hapterophycus canaliculatus]
MSAAPAFDEVWRWDGWTTLDESTRSGAVDLEGNIILVGSQSFEAVSYDPDDDTFIDAFSGDFATVKLNSDGEQLWTWIASSLGDFYDGWFDVDTDSSNDVVIGGKTEGYWESSNPDEVQHLAAVKLDGDTGDEVWRYQRRPSDSSSYAIVQDGTGGVTGVAVDGDDNVFLVGQVFGSLADGEGDLGDSGYFVIKLDGTDGSEIWVIQGGEPNSFDSLRAVKADPDGNVIAAGIGGDEDSVNLVVIKFSGVDGRSLWDYSTATMFTHDAPHAIDVDAQGDVYVSGGFDTENLQGVAGETPVVLKLDGTAGDVLWTYEGTATSPAVFFAVAVDPITGWVVGAGITEGVWLTGASQGNADFAAVLLDAEGNELSRYQNGTTNDEFLAFAGFDSTGDLLVGGTWADADHANFVAIKFKPFEDVAATPAPSPAPIDPAPTSAPVAPSPAPIDPAPTSAPVAPSPPPTDPAP